MDEASDSTVTPTNIEEQGENLFLDFSATVPPPPAVQRPQIPPGYPDPSAVFEDSSRAARLLSSGLMEHLRVVASQIVLNSGPTQVQTTLAGTEFSPYDQLVFAIAGRYYSSYPEINYDEKTFRFMHMCIVYSRNASVVLPASYVELQERYTEITSLGLVHLVTKIASVMLRAETANSADLNGMMSQNDFALATLQVKNHLASVYCVYKFTYQFTHGGVRAVDPIPELVRNSDLMSTYIDMIARGNGRILISNINITARSSTLHYVRPAAAPPVTIPATLATQASTSATPTSAEALPPIVVGMRRVAPNIPREVERTSLMAQGTPGRHQHIRNTTAFRESVADADSSRAMHTELLAAISAQNTTLTSVMEQLSAQGARLTALDRTLATLVSRLDIRDMRERADYNRTILHTDSPVAQEIISSAAPIRSGPTSLLEQLIGRIEANYSPLTDPNLLQELKDCLMAMGQTSAAENLRI